MVSAAPTLVAKTAKTATDLMASASFVVILDGRGHSAKREVITYSDIFGHINSFLHRLLICCLYDGLSKIFYFNDLKVWSLLKQCQDIYIIITVT